MHPATDRLARVAHYASPAPRDLRMRRRKAHLRSPKRRPRCVVRRPRNRLCSLGESERVRRGCSDDRVPDRQVPADQSTSPVSAEGNGGFFYYFPPVLGTAPRDASGGQFAVDLYECQFAKKGNSFRKNADYIVYHSMLKAIPSCPSPPIGTSLAPRWRRTRTRRT